MQWRNECIYNILGRFKRERMNQFELYFVFEWTLAIDDKSIDRTLFENTKMAILRRNRKLTRKKNISNTEIKSKIHKILITPDCDLAIAGSSLTYYN